MKHKRDIKHLQGYRQQNGVYMITNKVNGKVYVGMSNDVENRIDQHFKDLKANKHHNYPLQIDYNKQNEAFKAEILEYITQTELSLTEQYYIQFYNTGNLYNSLDAAPYGCYVVCSCKCPLAYKVKTTGSDEVLKFFLANRSN